MTIKDNVNYWDSYYRNEMINEESTFCKFVREQTSQEFCIIDLACGSGRDTRSFASNGYKIIGIDQSVEVIKNNKEKFLEIGNLAYENIDVSEKKKFNSFLKRVKEESANQGLKIAIYSRFFLHSIDEKTEQILLDVLSENLSKDDTVAFEFRTLEDEQIDKLFNNHFRRYIDAENLAQKIDREYGFDVDYFFKGQGLSIFRGEDPYLARLLCTKK